VGGSLVAAGGHNVLEPAWFGKVPLFGPHMQNFRDIAAAFLEEVAAIQVASADDLARRWEELLANPAKREAMGRAAQMLLERNQGATERTLERIAGVLAEHWTAHGAVTGRAV
jgi:3-deoxy-D-manno-octulosonic-acid transferase